MFFCRRGPDDSLVFFFLLEQKYKSKTEMRLDVCVADAFMALFFQAGIFHCAVFKKMAVPLRLTSVIIYLKNE